MTSTQPHTPPPDEVCHHRKISRTNLIYVRKWLTRRRSNISLCFILLSCVLFFFCLEMLTQIPDATAQIKCYSDMRDTGPGHRSRPQVLATGLGRRSRPQVPAVGPSQRSRATRWRLVRWR